MKTLKDVVDAQQQRRAPHNDPLTDRLLAALIEMAEEVCVLRDRLDTSARLAAEGKLADAAAVDAFEPEEAVIEQRLAAHRAYFESLFSRLDIL